MSQVISVPEYVSDDDKNDAYYFIHMLTKSLPIKNEEKVFNVNGVNLKLLYHKTKLKREADLKIEYMGKFYSTKFLHSDLHHYSDLETNWLVSFILKNKKEIENFVLQ